MVNPLDKLPMGDFAIPVYFDYIATFSWALSGAIVGARKRYDITGVFVIALVSSMGGSLIRDGFFLQRTPPVLTNGTYLILIVIAVFLIKVLSKVVLKLLSTNIVNKVIDMIDAIGIPSFAVVGMELALSQKISIPGVVLIGVINGVGGGLLRDLLSGEEPRLLLPGQLSALIVLFACMVYAVLIRWGNFDPTRMAITTIVVFFVIRALTIRFNWRTRPVLPNGKR